MIKVATLTFEHLIRALLIGSVLLLFHLLAPHSYAASWTLLGLNNKSIQMLAVDPTNPNTFYAVGQDVGAFKSTDGGTTWNAIDNGLPDPQHLPLYDIAVDPSNPNILYTVSASGCCGNTPGVFKSSNGGASWTDISPNIQGSSPVFWTIAIDPNNHNTVFVGSVGTCNGVWKTIDGGSSWSKGNGTCNMDGLLVDPRNPNIVLADEATFQKSTDGGTTWNNLNPSVFNNNGLGSLTIDPNNSNILYAGGGGTSAQLWKSTDEGATWASVPAYPGGDPGPGHTVIIDPTIPSTVYASNENNSYVVSSNDGGTTWNTLALPNNVIALGLLAPASTPGVLYAGTSAGVYVINFNVTGVGTIFISHYPVQVNTPFTAKAYFADTNTSAPHTASRNWGDGNTTTGTVTESNGSGSVSNSHTYTASGTYTITLTVTDNNNVSHQSTTTIVVDAPPHVNTLSGASINQGDTYSENGTFTDPDSTSWTAKVDYGDGGGAQPLTLSGTNFSLNHVYNTSGIFTVTVSVTDNQGATGTGTATVTVNAPPHVNSFSGATLNEGDTYSANGSFTDSDSSSWTATVDYGDSSGSQSLPLSGTSFSLSHVYKDNGTYTVTVNVTDNQGATGTGSATITVNNVAPSVGAITAPSSPVLVNTAITASANFTDPGVLDTHTASWNWGDGNTTTGTVTESNGSGSVSNSHTYAATGVYTITLTVTDKDGGQGTSTFQYVSVYDSNTSFAGGRSFDNPSSASPNTTGKVTFGVSSKYSGSTLTGSAKMDFKAANIDFASTSLSSLATSNGRAYLKGSGTVNGSGSYTFLATGIDGSVVGGNDLIRFQIKDSSNNVVYDSQPGASDTTDPTTVDATGNIRVH